MGLSVLSMNAGKTSLLGTHTKRGWGLGERKAEGRDRDSKCNIQAGTDSD